MGVDHLAVVSDAPSSSTRRDWAGLRYPLTIFAGLAVVLYAVAELSFAFLPTAEILPHGFPDYPGFNAWPRWDSDWYLHIAREGYYYAGPGQQSAVAFFPGYPAVVRAVMGLVRNDIVAGVIVSYLAGATAVVLFHRWCRGAFGARAARIAVLVLVLYPFAYYLFGAVYSDALFLAAVLGAFTLLESGHPWLAGVAGALAVGTRPVGLAVVLGLALRALEIRGVLVGGPPRFFPADDDQGDQAGVAVRHKTPLLPRAIRWRRLDWRDAGVLVSVLGLVAFCLLMWRNFGDPFVFKKVYSADGWNRTWDADTLLKAGFFERMRDVDFGYLHIYLGAAALFTVVGVALVPMILRRLGWGYAAYTIVVLAVPAATSAEFLGMGRYALAAFPCFALVAAVFAGERRPRGPGQLRRRALLTAGWLAVSGAGLALMMSLYARWYLIS
jgi:hypothetical protein